MGQIQWQGGPESRRTRLRRRLVHGWRRFVRAYHRITRPARWLPLLLLGVIIGVSALGGVQCALSSDLGDVGVPQGPPDTTPDLLITVTNAFLAQQIQQSADKGATPIPLHNVRVTTRDVKFGDTTEGHVFVFATTELLGRGIDGVIEMRPVLEEGLVRMKVVEAKFGPVPVPGNVERLVEAPINDRIQAAIAGYPATITSVRAVADGVMATARLRPRDASATPAPARGKATAPPSAEPSRSAPAPTASPER
jgi:hypothetical protein